MVIIILCHINILYQKLFVSNTIINTNYKYNTNLTEIIIQKTVIKI